MLSVTIETSLSEGGMLTKLADYACLSFVGSMGRFQLIYERFMNFNVAL